MFNKTTPMALALRMLILGSGLLALVYETAWFRLFALEFGSALLASTAVIAAFLLGNGLGSLAGTPLIRRSRLKPLQLYAVLELLVAVFNLLLPDLAAALGSMTFLGGVWPRALVIGVLVAIPSVLMGLTYPVFVHAYRCVEPERVNSASVVYFWNVVGAMLGALSAGTLLVPLVSLSVAVWVASGLGVVLAACSAWAARTAAAPTSDAADPDRAAAPPVSEVDTRSARFRLSPLWALMLLAFGLTSIGVEMVGLRLIFLLGGTSSLYFSVFISMYIGLTSLGVWLSQRHFVTARLTTFIVLAPVLLAVGVLLLILIYPVMPYYYVSWLRPSSTFASYFGCACLFSFVMLCVPCLAMGLFLPSVLSHFGLDDRSRFASASKIYGVYTIGNTLGAVGTGFVLFPLLGSYQTLVLFMLILGVVALCTAQLVRQWGQTPAWVGLAVVAAVTVLAPRWHANLPHFGAYAAPAVASERTPLNFMQATWARSETLYDHEGPMANIGVFRQADDTTFMMINGKSDAGTRNDMPVQVLLGLLPHIYSHTEAPTWGIVGLGAGITSAAAHATAPARMTIIELIQEVVDAARVGFVDYNRQLFESADVAFRIMDANYFFANTKTTFDVISQEPTNLWIRGTADLFSIEHFQNLEAALNPGGVVAVWVHTYSMNDATFYGILRTLHAVFPHIEIFEANPGDMVLIVSPEPLRLNLAHLDDLFEGPAAEYVRHTGIESRLGLLVKRLFSQAQVTRMVDQHPGTLLSQSRPLLEWQVLRAYLADSKALIGSRPRWGTSELDDWLAQGSAAQSPPQVGDYLALLAGYIGRPSVRKPWVTSLGDHIMFMDAANAAALLDKLAILEERGLRQHYEALLDQLLADYPDEPLFICNCARSLIEKRNDQRGLSAADQQRLRQLLGQMNITDQPTELDCPS